MGLSSSCQSFLRLKLGQTGNSQYYASRRIPLAKPKFTLYKHIKIDGQWRYFRAAVASNNKVKPDVIVVGGQEQKHEDGSYCVRHKNQWIDVGNDPAEALRRRTQLVEADSVEDVPAAPATKGAPLAGALKTYLSDLEALGRTDDTLTDHGLNKAISKIREALNDSAESPRFVE